MEVWNREYNDLGKQGWECSLRIVKKHFKVVRVVDHTLMTVGTSLILDDCFDLLTGRFVP